MLLGRWCIEISQRQLMWRLPSRARSYVDTLGVSALLVLSPYRVADVQGLLNDHETYEWRASPMTYQTRVSTTKMPKGDLQEIVEFVRIYSPAGVPSPGVPTNTVFPPLMPTAKMGEDDTTMTVGEEDEEIVASGSVPSNSTPEVEALLVGPSSCAALRGLSRLSSLFRVEQWWRKRHPLGLRTARPGSLVG
jgi:hypothetical protein